MNVKIEHFENHRPAADPLLRAFRSIYIGAPPGRADLCVGKVSIDEWLAGYGHQHPDRVRTLMLYVRSGTGRLTIGHHGYPLREASLAVIGPGKPHHYFAESDMVVLSASIWGPAARDIVTDRLSDQWGVWDMAHATEVDHAWRELVRLIDQDSNLIAERAVLSVQLMLLAAAEARMADMVGDHTSSARVRFLEIKRMIDRRFAELRSIDEVADACSVTPTHVARLFRRFAQTRPLAYLQKIKMDEAADLLRSTGLQVREIARRVGYDDEFVFSKAFKRILGQSPSAFRHHVGAGPGRRK